MKTGTDNLYILVIVETLRVLKGLWYVEIHNRCVECVISINVTLTCYDSHYTYIIYKYLLNIYIYHMFYIHIDRVVLLVNY